MGPSPPPTGNNEGSIGPSPPTESCDDEVATVC